MQQDRVLVGAGKLPHQIESIDGASDIGVYGQPRGLGHGQHIFVLVKNGQGEFPRGECGDFHGQLQVFTALQESAGPFFDVSVQEDRAAVEGSLDLFAGYPRQRIGQESVKALPLAGAGHGQAMPAFAGRLVIFHKK